MNKPYLICPGVSWQHQIHYPRSFQRESHPRQRPASPLGDEVAAGRAHLHQCLCCACCRLSYSPIPLCLSLASKKVFFAFLPNFNFVYPSAFIYLTPEISSRFGLFFRSSPLVLTVPPVINTKMPEIGELLLKRLIDQFKKSYHRNHKTALLSSTRFIAHLFNQQVAGIILPLEILVSIADRKICFLSDFLFTIFVLSPGLLS